MRIGVLTGGGDVPGLNPCIKAIVNRAEENGWETMGIRRGWAGLLNYNPDDDEAARQRWVQPLTRQNVRTIDRYGGTHLHTSRTNPQKVRPRKLPSFLKDQYPIGEAKTVDCTSHVLRALAHLRIDTLIPIGGDDTLSYRRAPAPRGLSHRRPSRRRWTTMSSAPTTASASAPPSPAASSSSTLCELPPAATSASPWSSCSAATAARPPSSSAYLADVDRALISEVPFDIERLARLVTDDRRRNPSRYAMVVVSEGASMIGGQVVEYGQEDAYGHKKLGGIGRIAGEALKRLTGIEIVNQQLAYLMRAGAPDSLDRMVATSYGNLAVQQIEQGHGGRMVALQNGVYTTVPVDTCTQGLKRVDVTELYDSDVYRPKVSHVLGKPMFLY